MLPVLCAVILAGRSQEAQNIGASDLYKRALPSVMTLTVEKPGGTSIGTGFLVGPKGVAATAWHVVANATSAKAKFADGEVFEVSGLIDKDEKRDVALVRVKVAGRPTLEIATDDPIVGSRAYVIGAPESLEFSITEGLVSQMQTLDGRRVIQFSCPASPGNSGGPLLNADCKALGVVSFQRVDGQNLNFAVPGGIVAGLDSTLPTQTWGNVKPSKDAMHTEVLFDVNKYGSPTWNGAFQDRRNPWRAFLVYYENTPVVPENVMVGLIAYSGETGERVDARGLSIAQVSVLRKYIREFLDTDQVKEIAPSKHLDMPTIRFAANEILFTDKPLAIDFNRRAGNQFKGGKWEIIFRFDRKTNRVMGRTEAATFLETTDLWFRMLKEDGLDVEARAPK